MVRVFKNAVIPQLYLRKEWVVLLISNQTQAHQRRSNQGLYRRIDVGNATIKLADIYPQWCT
jgi:hypothetical protein